MNSKNTFNAPFMYISARTCFKPLPLKKYVQRKINHHRGVLMLSAFLLFQIAVWLMSVFTVWLFVPDWLGISEHFPAMLIAWAGGSLLFLFALTAVYAVECVLRPGVGQ